MVNDMKLSEAIKIINHDVYDRCITEEEILEAHMVFWKALGVNIKNPDGSYKSMYTIFEEASKCFNK
jgi:hypothetical protein